MFRSSFHCQRQPWAQSFLHRLYSTSPPKSNVQLVSELRKLTNAPILKARQALTEANGDFDAALKWLEKDLLASGAAKAEKIKDRVASEGLISVSVADAGIGSQMGGPVKAAIVELNCESDFVARTDDFARLAADIAQTVAQNTGVSATSAFSTLDVAALLETPLVSSQRSGATVGNSIVDLIARIGENITLRRAALLSPARQAGTGFRAASYIHNPLPNSSSQGRIGTLALLSLRSARLSELLKEEALLSELAKFERALCRQIVGFRPLSVQEPVTSDAGEDSILYKQPFGMIGGEKASLPVRQVMDEWQKERGFDEFGVSEFVRWEVGQSGN
ncbi:Elongation factor Ts, mitochondrial [Marasmius crinis-equi]|uniref:Elongation factor Ts, mitochondrial n=1 Tax=Marasmius crinis-equi TaxID=585013 RepID=A0ABR3G057_9AGAR